MTDETNIMALPPVTGGAVTSPITPQAMLGMAVARGDTELAAKLMDLVERWEARQARRAFETAIADCNFPVIVKNRKMDAGTGRTTYWYEDLAAIAEAIGDELSAHGLSYRFRTHVDDKRVSVTCIISHRDGHSEENTLSSAPDTSGSKNAVQAVGSALSYLQRYSLKAALGLAAAVDDDATGKGGPITAEQLADLNVICTNTGVDIARFCALMGVGSLADIRAAKYGEALAQLSRKMKK